MVSARRRGFVMNVNLSERVALVTGGARGIGKAIAEALAQNGAVVAVNDINPGGEAAADGIRRKGGRAAFYQADIGDARAVNEMVAIVEKDLGPIAILVNNAGINVVKERRPVHDFLDADWRAILRVDLDGVFYCSRAVSSNMVRRRKGVIINIGSILGIVPMRLQSAFDAAKAGMLNFTRGHALEAAPHGIRVNAIAPGSILTDVTQELFYNPASQRLAESLLAHIPLGKPGEPEDIANAVLFLVSDEARYITGHVLVVDGGWTVGFARDW
ncbi:MAG TPA: 3-oxoacyl-ACP reductase FabG [Terriglobia bacterium]|nr:3-oxoacyl-ACP reductase FabG [Terriglobia bacterium]